MLQAYIDESLSDGLFVMAGYVANAEQWAHFSNDWARLLTLRSPHYRWIKEMHMVEMANSKIGIEQSKLFYRLIEKHLTNFIACSVDIATLNAVHKSTQWPSWIENVDRLSNEYFVCFEGLIRALSTEQRRLGISGPVDVVFDDNQNKKKCLQAWDALSKLGPIEVGRLLGSPPTFRKSHEVMPLQAADMLAYWVREGMIEKAGYGVSLELNFPWKKEKSISGIGIVYEVEHIRRNFRDIILACALLISDMLQLPLRRGRIREAAASAAWVSPREVTA